jgi:cell wall-associated NlpC family hydrolase
VSGRARRGHPRLLVVARDAFADLRAAPRHTAALVSQAVLGELLDVVRVRSGWLLAEAANGYRGWVRDWAVAPLGPARAARFRAGPGLARVVVASAPLLAAPRSGADRVGEAGFLARLPVLARRGVFLRVDLPGRRSAWLRRAAAEPWPAAKSPPPPARLIAIGRTLLGTPYLWGGTTSRGYDCSGFALRLYEWAGIALPRDARDQAALGRDFDDPRAARPGDLLFFGPRGRPIGHVAIAIGAGRILHAAPPCVRVDGLTSGPSERVDLLRTFRGGRRYERAPLTPATTW